ncbi:ferredoxin [Candidatus Falkowbacteria bacterium]|nr:MAG: ferredoxin [Candidatus Falkowbacteria bacterium]
MKNMKIEIEKNKCIGCGVCASVCPEGIEMINGVATIKNADADCLQNAAEVCPVNIIKIN